MIKYNRNASRFLPALLLLVGPQMARAASVNYTVPGTVPKLKQPTDSTCWATSATMLVSWKANTSIGVEDAMKQAGANYAAAFRANQALQGSEKPAFLKALKLKAEGPQTFSVSGLESLLRKYGPLWVTTNEGGSQFFAVHARVVRGIAGDGTPGATFLTVIDPATGSEASESVAVFTKKFEDIARNDLGGGADLRPQIVHY
jgi:Papain-like cysteine protease AvrRpt2